MAELYGIRGTGGASKAYESSRIYKPTGDGGFTRIDASKTVSTSSSGKKSFRLSSNEASSIRDAFRNRGLPIPGTLYSNRISFEDARQVSGMLSPSMRNALKESNPAPRVERTQPRNELGQVSNVDVAYYKADGTPVYGRQSTVRSNIQTSKSPITESPAQVSAPGLADYKFKKSVQPGFYGLQQRILQKKSGVSPTPSQSNDKLSLLGFGRAVGQEMQKDKQGNIFTRGIGKIIESGSLLGGITQYNLFPIAERLPKKYQSGLTKEEKRKAEKSIETAGWGAAFVASLATPIPFDEQLAGAGLMGNIGRTSIGVGRAIGRAELGLQGFKSASKATASKQTSKIINDPKFKTALSAGFEAQSKTAYQRSWIKGLGQDLNIGFVDTETEKSFYEGMKKSLTGQGITGKQQDQFIKAAKRERKFKIGADAFAMLQPEVEAEAFSRPLQRTLFKGLSSSGKKFTKKQFAWQLAKTEFKRGAYAGIIEGTTASYGSQRVREEKISPKKIAVSGGFGAATAGIFSSAIGGFKVTKPGVSKSIEWIGYIADPAEKPGDILADIGQKGLSRASGKNFPKPIIKSTLPKKTPTFSFGLSLGSISKTSSKTPSKTATKTKSPGFTPINSFMQSLVGTPTKTQTKTPSLTPNFAQNFIGTPSKMPTQTNIPVNVPTQTDVPVNVPTETPLLTFTNVPVTTPTILPRIPPPIPLSFPAGSGGIGSRKGKRKKYVDERKQAKQLFDKLFADPFATPKKKRKEIQIGGKTYLLKRKKSKRRKK